MKLFTLIALFSVFALGLPSWLMMTNDRDIDRIHNCSGSCYDEWKEKTGGVVFIAQAAAAERDSASPEELGKKAYLGCIACHGSAGEGGLGPQLSGQPVADIVGKLNAYKNGETRGAQSNLMWGQAAALTPSDISNIAAYIATF